MEPDEETGGRTRHDLETAMKCIAWDLDGCLVDTDELHYVALNSALTTSRPDAIITPEEHRDIYKGLPTRVKLDMLTKEGRILHKDQERIYQHKQRATEAAIFTSLRPNPEVVSLLSTLTSLGFRQGIVSNCIRLSVDAIILSAGLGAFIEFSVSNEDVTNAKPDPEPYYCAAVNFKIHPEKMIAIEDGEAGRKSARAAGCTLLSIEGPHEVTRANLIHRILSAQSLITYQTNRR